MRKSTFSKIPWIILIFMSVGFINFRENALVLTWTETTVEDFSDSILEDVIITNTADGEVRLPFGMVKTVEDYRDDSIHRFVAYDQDNNFVETWVESRNVFVQKYSPDGSAIGEKIKVNEIEGIAGRNGTSRVAMMDDGTFIVVWLNNGPETDYMTLGQIFKQDTLRVGNNFQIKDHPDSGGRSPIVFANNTDSTFWILYSEGDFDNGFKIFAQRRNLQAERVEEPFRLNSENFTKHETVSTASVDKDNNFIIGWSGFDEPSSDKVDIYARRFNSDGHALGPAFKANDDSGDNYQGLPDVSFDSNSNFLFVWMDQRDNTREYGPYDFNIYGQLYRPDGSEIGNNFKINEPRYPDDRDPDVTFLDGEFQVSWRSWNQATRIYETYVTRWKIDSKLSGTLVSSIFDTGPGGTNFGRISWDEVLYDSTSIHFKVRTAPSLEELEQAFWYGSNDTSGYYFVSSGESINPVHNGDQVIQYQAFLNTSIAGVSPILKSVSIDFVPSDTIPPASPSNLTAVAGHSSVISSWEANTEPDLAKYYVYRSVTSANFSLLTQISASEASYADTSAVTGTTYYYAISAVDRNHNESDLSEIVSATPNGINLYVDATISDGVSNFFTSIQKALDTAAFGDTVVVFPGTYNEMINMKEGVAIIGSGAQLTKIIGPTEATDYIIKGANDAVLKGFTIIRNQSSASLTAILCDEASPIISENVIVNDGGGFSTAISCIKASPTISKNLITSFEMGIYCTNQTSPVIKNNIIKAAIGVMAADRDSPKVINNTVLAESSGIRFIRGGESPEVKNNIIYGLDNTSAFGIYNDQSANTSLSYNNIWNTYKNYDGISAGTGDISVDPLFQNFAREDYRLQAGSSCIDAGDPNSQYNDVDGSRNDMGAFGGSDPMDVSLTLELAKSIGITRISGFPGDTVTAFVTLDNPVGLAKADLSISYDKTLLSAIVVQLTTTTSDFALQSDISIAGEVGVSMEGAVEVDGGNGNVLKITFVVASDAQSEDASALLIETVSLYDGLQNPIWLRSINDGVFVVNLGSEDGNYIYVDAINDGLEDGSREHPYNTIQEGIEQASAGDTIVVASGDYYGQIGMKEGVYLRGAGALATTILTSNDNTPVIFNGVGNGEISGFTIKGQTENPLPIPLISCRSSSPRITRNRIENFAFGLIGAIECEENSNPTIEGNALVHSGILISSSSPLIRNNFIEGALGGGRGIVCRDSSAPMIFGNKISGGDDGTAISARMSSPTIINNRLLCGTRSGGIGLDIYEASYIKIANNIIRDAYGDGFGISVRNSSNITIINNTINTQNKGVNEDGSSVLVLNNIITGNKEFGVHISSSSTLSYNDIWGNADDYYNTSPGEHDISADPLFADESSGDYRLTIGSPCIDAGNPDPQYNDLDGSRNDVGAFGGPDADSTQIVLGGMTLSIPSMQAAPGDTVRLQISGNYIAGIADVEAAISYSPAVLSFLNMRTTALTHNFSLTKTNILENIVNFSMSSPVGIKSDKGDIVEIVFIINEIVNTNSFIRFEYANIKDEVANKRSILKLEDGEITVTTTGIENPNELVNELPDSYNLFQNYPNPFNPQTTIKYHIPNSWHITLCILNVLGQEVRTLVDENQPAGNYSIVWDGKNLAGEVVSSGVYFYQLSVKERHFRETKKLLLLR